MLDWLTGTDAGKMCVTFFLSMLPVGELRIGLPYGIALGLEYPLALMAIEMPFKVSRMRKRSDLVVYNNHTEPLMLVECKAPDVPLTDRVFDQAAVYNLQIKAPCILLTNGVTHYCMELDPALNRYQFMIDIPYYSDLATMAGPSPDDSIY